jgi:MFS family permease
MVTDSMRRLDPCPTGTPEGATAQPSPCPTEPGPVPARGLRHAVRAFRYRDFALFWIGAFISSVGTWMQNVTVPYVLHQVTGSATWVGLGAFAQFLPAMLIGPIGGAFADRYPRRRILVVSQSVSMVFAFALWLSVRQGDIRPGLLVALVAGGGVAAGFGIVAWQSFVPELVPREMLLNAVALNSAQFNASRAVGFMLGGLVLSGFGPATAFLANAVSYLAVIAAVLAVRAGRHPHPGADPATGAGAGSGGFREALAYVRERPGIRLAILTVGVVAFLGSPVIQLAPVFARDEFHVGARAYGLLASALGIGATFGAVVLGAYFDGVRRSRLAVVATSVYGAAVLGLALTPVYAGGVAAMFVIGMGYLVIVSALNTSIQISVDDHFRGRVLALYLMAFTGAYPVGSLIQGRLADMFGVRPVVASAGLGLLAYAAVLAARPSAVRSLDHAAAEAPSVPSE